MAFLQLNICKFCLYLFLKNCSKYQKLVLCSCWQSTYQHFSLLVYCSIYLVTLDHYQLVTYFKLNLGLGLISLAKLNVLQSWSLMVLVFYHHEHFLSFTSIMWLTNVTCYKRKKGQKTTCQREMMMWTCGELYSVVCLGHPWHHLLTATSPLAVFLIFCPKQAWQGSLAFFCARPEQSIPFFWDGHIGAVTVFSP